MYSKAQHILFIHPPLPVSLITSINAREIGNILLKLDILNEFQGRKR